MIKGERYKFLYTDQILIYLGYNFSGNGFWHQFRKEDEDKVWSEIGNSDLRLIEKVEDKNETTK